LADDFKIFEKGNIFVDSLPDEFSGIDAKLIAFLLVDIFSVQLQDFLMR